jgi:DNA-binding transcriptional ArsR family regulator
VDTAKLDDSCQIRAIDQDRVTALVGRLPTASHVELLSDVFALLGDPSRLRLLTALLEAGELCVCDLAAVTSMSESSVSHALRLLRLNRVVRARRSGRMAYYSLSDAHVRMLLDLGLQHLEHADG